MFELMDTSSDRAILTVINSGSSTKESLELLKETTPELNCFINQASKFIDIQIEMIESIKSSDMMIIIVDLSDTNELELAQKIAKLSKESGVLTIAIGIIPSPFAETEQNKISNDRIHNINKYVDSLLIISNEYQQKDLNLDTILKLKDDLIIKATLGITEIIYRPGLIRVDFADVRTVLSERGLSKMGVASASGENRAKYATEQAVSQLISEDFNILSNSSGLIVTIKAGMDMSIAEFEDAGNIIKQFVSDNTTVVVGTVIDSDMSGDMQVTIICCRVKLANLNVDV